MSILTTSTSTLPPLSWQTSSTPKPLTKAKANLNSPYPMVPAVSAEDVRGPRPARQMLQVQDSLGFKPKGQPLPGETLSSEGSCLTCLTAGLKLQHSWTIISTKKPVATRWKHGLPHTLSHRGGIQSVQPKKGNPIWGEGTARNKPQTSCEGTLAKTCWLRHILKRAAERAPFCWVNRGDCDKQDNQCETHKIEFHLRILRMGRAEITFSIF